MNSCTSECFVHLTPEVQADLIFNPVAKKKAEKSFQISIRIGVGVVAMLKRPASLISTANTSSQISIVYFFVEHSSDFRSLFIKLIAHMPFFLYSHVLLNMRSTTVKIHYWRLIFED